MFDRRALPATVSGIGSLAFAVAGIVAHAIVLVAVAAVLAAVCIVLVLVMLETKRHQVAAITGTTVAAEHDVVDVQLRTMQTLRTRGVDARLTVIGATPPALHGNENVTLLGPLDKGRPEEERLFHRTLASAHFLIQPSFESYGFAFCEAAAYGLPSLCLDIGGVPVRDGVTGHPLPAGAAPSDFADVVMRHLADPAGYAALRASSRTAFESSLNWDAWAKSAIALMASRLKRPAAR